MVFDTTGERLTLTHIVPSSPAAWSRAWRTRIRGAWLRKVGDKKVDTVTDVKEALEKIAVGDSKECILTFSHPEVAHGLTGDGIPQVNLDQMNPRRMMDPSFCTLAMEAQRERGEFVPDRPHNGLLQVVERGGSSKLQDPRDEAHAWQTSEGPRLERLARIGVAAT
jgi:hypothetical protein